MVKKSAKTKGKKGKTGQFVLSSLVFLSILSALFCVVLIHDLPDLDKLETNTRRASIVFESYDGKPIATYGDLFKKVVKIDALPKHVWQAVVAIEDKRFFQHCGVDFVGIFRALCVDLMNRRVVQGGSTLTQQLAKNLFFSQNRSVKRKVQEIVLSLWLEKKFTKKQILSIYLNRVYFGAGAYGIDAAAYRFFGKSATKLTLYESAKLAGLLRSPVIYSPFYSQNKSDERAELVLSKMAEMKYITEAQKRDALDDANRKTKLSVLMDENRYFTDWVLEQVQTLVRADEEDLIVRTTLDSNLQKYATYVIREILNSQGLKLGASQMALVSLDSTGAVRAMVGGHTYNTSQFNRVLAQRSFGSAFKYFVFLSALENGVDPYDRISDMPIRIGNWSPKNYHYKSVGSVHVTDAFAHSLNTCTVRLAQRVGMDYIIDKTHQLGVSSRLHRNFATALGASGTNLLEMTAAYGAIMKNGIKMIPFGVISIKTQRGKVLYKAKKPPEIRAVGSDVCQKMKEMMRAVIERGTGRRAQMPIPSYGKTGTSNDSRDASFIGFIPPLVTGVWTGNDDNSPMRAQVTGGTLPAAAWKNFMLAAFHYNYPKQNETVKPQPKKNDSVKIQPKQQSAKNNFSAKSHPQPKKKKLSEFIKNELKRN